MIIDNEDENGEDLTSAKQFAARMPYPLAIGGGQQLPGRTRRCGFWISSFVPDDVAYVVDTSQLEPGWPHNPAGDKVPEDALLVVINPRYEDHIRKAMATWKAVPHPAYVAARIIDDECSKDATLAARMRWKVKA